MKDKLKKVKKPAKLLKAKKKKFGEPKKKAKMQAMSVDDFMNDFVNEEDDCGSEKAETSKKSKKKNLKSKTKGKRKSENKTFEDNETDEEDDIDDDDDDNSNQNDEYRSHKKQLDKLKQSDPDFYKYLEENDQELLNFDDSDDDSEDGEKNEKFHKTPDSLEVASDESDYEVDEEIKEKRKGDKNFVSQDMIKKWQEELSKGSIKALRDVTEVFHAALVSVSPDDGDATAAYKVEGASAFNSVIRMCVVDFLPGVQKALKVPPSTKAHPKSSKNWSKVKPILKSYLVDLAELSGVSSPSMLSILLKHIHQLSPFIACFPSVAPKFLKRVIQLWAGEEDVVRVLAFLCALRLANLRPSLLRQALKVMHLTYVRNTKFVSPNTLPGINFMRQSLCEMFALDTTVSYHMAFIYIRQLAIHLRNAITLKKKDSYKTVYNWAFVSSLHLWAELFGMVPRDSPLRTLTYPLVQIIIGTIKLIPSAQFFPLRFHCVRILINTGNKCGVFIPILPFLIEVLKDFNFNREHKKLSMKPMDLTCLLRCSKSQMKENGFKDALIENVHDLLMEYLASECHRVSFPDLTVPCVIEMKQFLKTCTVANYNKKIKAILDKLTENSKFIESERKKLSLKLEDLGGLEAAETGLRVKEPPFLRYYDSWKKIHLQQQARKMTGNQKLGDFKLPVLYKLEKKRSRIDTKPVGPPELFPSDEDSDDDNILNEEIEEEEEEPPKKRKKERKEPEARQKPSRKEPEMEEDLEEDGGDIVEDINISDFV